MRQTQKILDPVEVRHLYETMPVADILIALSVGVGVFYGELKLRGIQLKASKSATHHEDSSIAQTQQQPGAPS